MLPLIYTREITNSFHVWNACSSIEEEKKYNLPFEYINYFKYEILYVYTLI